MSQAKYDVFICHSRKDIAIVDKVCAALENEKISYFIDRKGLDESNETLESLNDIMANSKLFLLLASENSYGSDFILDLIREADYIVPIVVSYVIDGAKLPLEIDDLFGFMDWYNIDDHPIETGLMDNLVRLLGRGYRKSVLTEREKYLLSLPDDEFVKFKETSKYGFGDFYGFKLKSTGEIVVSSKYREVSNFCEGMAKVAGYNDVGFIDKTGAEVVPLEYYGAESFSEGLAVVWAEEGCGFVDKTGKLVVPTKYVYCKSFSEGLAVVESLDNGEDGFINNKGEIVIPCKYYEASSFKNGLAKVKLNNKVGFIDKNGNEIIPMKYDDARPFSEGLACVKLNNLWGFVDDKGNEVIPVEQEYDLVYAFYGGLACVKSNGKYGFINKTGEVVIPIKYDFNIFTIAMGFLNGETTRVKLNGEEFWIDKEGNRVEY